jgi:phosphoglycerate dehydrogenase-like enzyme
VLTPRVMDGLPKCRLIIRWGAGCDMIDAGAATAQYLQLRLTGTAIMNSLHHSGLQIQ